jgi:hypothetical protein
MYLHSLFKQIGFSSKREPVGEPTSGGKHDGYGCPKRKAGLRMRIIHSRPNFTLRRSYSTMQSTSTDHVSARSSVYSLAYPQESYDLVDEDKCIARELLHTAPNERRSSLTLNSSGLRDLKIEQFQRSDVPANYFENRRSRRAYHTSNTWTSSDSGYILSDQDEIDDRSVFVEEYNRLAKKVMRPCSPCIGINNSQP